MTTHLTYSSIKYNYALDNSTLDQSSMCVYEPLKVLLCCFCESLAFLSHTIIRVESMCVLQEKNTYSENLVKQHN